jgi:cytochrome P450/NADPH-cytochrome P450 reductase
VLFGSNLGTAESIAAKLAQEGTERGFAVTLGALDDHVDDLPHDGALLVVCSSYNGTPPDNAAAFCKEIPAAEGVVYSVFGCGSTEWASTYQAVPKLLDDQLAAHGGRRIRDRGEGNAAGDFDAAYRDWHGGVWSDLATALNLPAEVGEATAPTGPRLSITLTNRQVTNPVIVSYEARPATVRANRELILGTNGKPAERSTRHIEVALAGGAGYHTGDHLGVLPRNGVDLVRRVITRFRARRRPVRHDHPEQRLAHPPADRRARPAARGARQLRGTAGRRGPRRHRHPRPPHHGRGATGRARGTGRGRLQRPGVRAQPVAARPAGGLPGLRAAVRGVPRHAAAAAPALLLHLLLAPGRPGRLQHHRRRLRGPARSGTGTFTGIGSGYLAGLPENGTVFAFVRSPSIAFHPPENPHTPMIMVGAGTGLAPFRGFLQDRAALQDQGVPVGPSLLFFGCRNAEVDLLYADELRGYSDRGLVRVENAFSAPPMPRAATCRTPCSTARTRCGTCSAATPPSSCAATLHDRAGRPECPDADLRGQDRDR